MTGWRVENEAKRAYAEAFRDYLSSESSDLVRLNSWAVLRGGERPIGGIRAFMWASDEVLISLALLQDQT